MQLAEGEVPPLAVRCTLVNQHSHINAVVRLSSPSESSHMRKLLTSHCIEILETSTRWDRQLRLRPEAEEDSRFLRG